jgi:bifunctional non-homologous end joining protein LigD
MRRDGPTVRLYSRNACDWTLRLAAIAAAAEQIKAKSFTIDGKAVVLRPDSWSRFEELSRREATRIAILGAFDLIERDGDDCAICRSSTARQLWRVCCAILRLGPIVFGHACRLGTEVIVSKRVDGTYRSGPCRVWIKTRNPASIAVQRERSEMWNR